MSSLTLRRFCDSGLLPDNLRIVNIDKMTPREQLRMRMQIVEQDNVVLWQRSPVEGQHGAVILLYGDNCTFFPENVDMRDPAFRKLMTLFLGNMI